MDQISKSFSGVNILKNCSFSVAKGERVSLIGPGGCGKSTLLKILLGLMPPDSGKASLMGVNMLSGPIKDRERVLRSVGMAFQQGGLFDFMTVNENLQFAMSNMTNYPPEAMNATIHRLLAAVKLARSGSLFPHELSGGMKRRVGIARALCVDPKIAIFDEPTAGLDPVTSSIILKMILDLGGRNPEASLLCATSNVEIAIRFAERIILIHDSEVVADGNWKDLLLCGDPWIENFLGIRFIGLDLAYAKELHLPEPFIAKHWV